MKRSIVGAAALALALLPAAGTRGATPEAPPEMPSAEQMAERFTAGLLESLGLTDEQAPRVQAVLVDMMQRQRQSLLRQAGEEIGPAAMRALMQEVSAAQTAAREALTGVLTEEQLAGFDRALGDQRAQAVGEGMARRLEQPLDLSPKQRDEVAAIFEKHVRARAELIASTRSATGRFGASRAIREKLPELQRQLEQDLSQVLSPEQLAKYREIVAEARRSRGRARPTETP